MKTSKVVVLISRMYDRYHKPNRYIKDIKIKPAKPAKDEPIVTVGGVPLHQYLKRRSMAA